MKIKYEDLMLVMKNRPYYMSLKTVAKITGLRLVEIQNYCSNDTISVKKVDNEWKVPQDALIRFIRKNT